MSLHHHMTGRLLGEILAPRHPMHPAPPSKLLLHLAAWDREVVAVTFWPSWHASCPLPSTAAQPRCWWQWGTLAGNCQCLFSPGWNCWKGNFAEIFLREAKQTFIFPCLISEEVYFILLPSHPSTSLLTFSLLCSPCSQRWAKTHSPSVGAGGLRSALPGSWWELPAFLPWHKSKSISDEIASLGQSKQLISSLLNHCINKMSCPSTRSKCDFGNVAFNLRPTEESKVSQGMSCGTVGCSSECGHRGGSVAPQAHPGGSMRSIRESRRYSAVGKLCCHGYRECTGAAGHRNAAV